MKKVRLKGGVYTKTCYVCKKTKDISLFSQDNSKSDGFRGNCKSCRSSYTDAERKVRKEQSKANRLEHMSRRRARKRKAIPEFLSDCLVEQRRIRDVYKLRQLIEKITGIPHHVDHMWPLSDGGPHWSGNLQILTASENLRKSNKICKITKKSIRDSLKIARREYEDHSTRHRNREP
jgi:5-methylcytosine-specific restriction endonuclease McrA